MIKNRTTKSATPSTVRQVNIAEVLQALWNHESLSRAEITTRLGLSATTMAKLMSSLTNDNIITEIASEETAGKGRPSKHYKLNNKQIGLIIVLLGISDTRIAAFSPDGKLILGNEESFATPKKYPDLISKVKVGINKVAANFSKNATIVLGVSIPGMIKEAEHYVELSPNMQFLNNQKPALDLCDNTKFIPKTIQEERALCLAQCTDSRYSKLSDIVAIDLSEGFGLGILSNNSLIQGSKGFAGELGHVSLFDEGPECACGKRGCFEVLATDSALVNQASKIKNRTLSFDDIHDLLNDSDSDIIQIIDNICRNLAKAIAITINLFNPQAVLLHARMLDIESYNVLDNIKKYINDDSISVLTKNCIIDAAPVSRRYGVSKSASEKLFHTLITEPKQK